VAEKVTFLSVLATNLSIEDAEFLDTVRADRSLQVTEAALPLLARLTAGPYHDRRAVALASHFEAKGGLLRKKSVDVREFDPDPKEGIPEGAAWSVVGFIRHTPLDLWHKVLHADPADLVTWAWTGIPIDPAQAFFLAAAEQGDEALQVAVLGQVKRAPWNLLDDDDAIAALPLAVRLHVARRALAEISHGGLTTAQQWLGDTLPPEVLPEAVDSIARDPRQLALATIVTAFTHATPDQVAELRRLVDQAPETNRPAALRHIGHLTLLIRLNQELS
jgi:hypothetical protein